MVEKQTLGQSIDTIIKALDGLDDNSKRIAINAACEHFSVNVDYKSNNKALEQAVIETKKTLVLERKIIDIRSLKDEKKPRTAMQMACLVAYYLQEIAPEEERKIAINASDLNKYFKQAGYKLPKVVRQLLPDGKFAGYFEHSGNGFYKLSPVGYNLVVHTLPKNKE